MSKDYYLILGVPVGASPEDIRSAFRERAKRYHPDHAGPAGARWFRELSEAYEMLSDPIRRARYDRESARDVRPEPDRTVVRKREPEPLVAEAVPITGRPEAVRPSFEALFERLTRQFAGGESAKAAQAGPLNFELVVSREEAERGVWIPFRVPVMTLCPHCEGSGREWPFPCGECDGSGRLVDYRTVRVAVPSGVRDGTVIEVPLTRLGIENLWLRVYVRVAGH